MATGQAPRRDPETARRAIAPHRLDGVLAAGGRVAAGGWQPGGHHGLVGPQRPDDHLCRHRLHIIPRLLFCPRVEARTSGQPTQAFRPLRLQAVEGNPGGLDARLQDQIPTRRQCRPMSAGQRPQAPSNAIAQRCGAQTARGSQTHAGGGGRNRLAQGQQNPVGAVAAPATATDGAKLRRMLQATARRPARIAARLGGGGVNPDNPGSRPPGGGPWRGAATAPPAPPWCACGNGTHESWRGGGGWAERCASA